MNKEKCNVLIPGGFKPVHAGHIMMINDYLNNKDYDVNVAVVFGHSDRDGITAESSKAFFDKIFKDNDKVDIILSDKETPILDVYNMTGARKYGKGLYAMGVSSKDDPDRVISYTNCFKDGGKYYTPGVKTIILDTDADAVKYSGRGDIYEGKPISASVVRADVQDDNYKKFRTSYYPLLSKSIIDEETLKEYYDALRKEIIIPDKKHVNDSTINESYICEGGLAGHMNHPYEVDDFTFGDLKALIKDLFVGKITDVTEKLDGQNLFASVDDNGNTIFARNKEHIEKTPWRLEDVMHNPKWISNSSVQHAFSNGAVTVDKVFKNIPNAASVFNYDDTADGIRYRTWVNLEIIDTENANVIPYVESKVSFHGFVCYCFDCSDKNIENHSTEIFDLPESQAERLTEILKKAIKKTDKANGFDAQITPTLVFKKVMNASERAQKYIDRVSRIQENLGVNDNCTILDYKKIALENIIDESSISFLSGDVLELLIDRWICDNKKIRINDILKNYSLAGNDKLTNKQIDIVNRFDKERIPSLLKSIVAPFDKIFIDLGNEIIKQYDGLANSGHELSVIKTLKREIKKLKDALADNNDPKLQKKLRTAINRLSNANYELNSTEGLVFKYNGHVIKLTGSFAPLNALLGLTPGKFDKK